jgi:mRNA interferase HicA
MKKKDLEKELRNLGFWQTEGGKHDKWTNGVEAIPVPRHKEINEFTAKGIIKSAKKYQKETK